jgi:hypothetical protein
MELFSATLVIGMFMSFASLGMTVAFAVPHFPRLPVSASPHLRVPVPDCARTDKIEVRVFTETDLSRCRRKVHAIGLFLPIFRN